MAEKKRVLVVEANEAFGKKIAESLNAAGYSALYFGNGIDGLKSITESAPDLILLDVTLPGMDGYDILVKMQNDDKLKKLPVFLLSTQGVPISIGKVPKDSVKEFIITMHADEADVVSKVNAYFGVKTVTAGNANRSKKILWIEDDKLISTILGKKLDITGFELVHASNGEEAIEELSQYVPNVIVLDLLLPGMSGFDILKRINDNPMLKTVPVMILSNLSKQSDIDRARLLGAKKFLVKAATSLDQIALEIAELAK